MIALNPLCSAFSVDAVLPEFTRNCSESNCRFKSVRNSHNCSSGRRCSDYVSVCHVHSAVWGYGSKFWHLRDLYYSHPRLLFLFFFLAFAIADFKRFIMQHQQLPFTVVLQLVRNNFLSLPPLKYMPRSHFSRYSYDMQTSYSSYSQPSAYSSAQLSATFPLPTSHSTHAASVTPQYTTTYSSPSYASLQPPSPSSSKYDGFGRSQSYAGSAPTSYTPSTTAPGTSCGRSSGGIQCVI